jgi:hypothetical protein
MFQGLLIHGLEVVVLWVPVRLCVLSWHLSCAFMPMSTYLNSKTMSIQRYVSFISVAPILRAGTVKRPHCLFCVRP